MNTEGGNLHTDVFMDPGLRRDDEREEKKRA
jgi:hypothetical protein